MKIIVREEKKKCSDIPYHVILGILEFHQIVLCHTCLEYYGRFKKDVFRKCYLMFSSFRISQNCEGLSREVICRFPNIRKMKNVQFELDQRDSISFQVIFQAFVQSTVIKSLELEYLRVEGEDLRLFRGMTSLTRLNFRTEEHPYVVFSELQTLKQLRNLNVRFEAELKKKEIQKIEMSSLRKLEIFGSENTSFSFEKMKDLRSLKLNSISLPSEAVSSLECLENLKEVSLDTCGMNKYILSKLLTTNIHVEQIALADCYLDENLYFSKNLVLGSKFFRKKKKSFWNKFELKNLQINHEYQCGEIFKLKSEFFDELTKFGGLKDISISSKYLKNRKDIKHLVGLNIKHTTKKLRSRCCKLKNKILLMMY